MEKVYQYITRVQECRKEEKVGIIIPSHKFKDFNQFMKEKGENLSVYNLKNEKNNITFGTYKQIKGLEFNTVIMPFLSKENFIKSIEIDNNEIDLDDKNFKYSDLDSEIIEKDIVIHYYGVNRAKKKLIILYSGQLTPLLASLALSKYVYGGEGI